MSTIEEISKILNQYCWHDDVRIDLNRNFYTGMLQQMIILDVLWQYLEW